MVLVPFTLVLIFVYKVTFDRDDILNDKLKVKLDR